VTFLRLKPIPKRVIKAIALLLLVGIVYLPFDENIRKHYLLKLQDFYNPILTHEKLMVIFSTVLAYIIIKWVCDLE